MTLKEIYAELQMIIVERPELADKPCSIVVCSFDKKMAFFGDTDKTVIIAGFPIAKPKETTAQQ